MNRTALVSVLVLAATAAAAGCAGTEEGGDVGFATGATIEVDEFEAAKADNYVSTNAREYALTTRVEATLPTDFATLEGDARATALEQTVTNASGSLARAVRTHVDSTVRAGNGGTMNKEDKWFTYVKSGQDTLAQIVTNSDTTVTFEWEMELIGSYYLMSLLSPGEAAVRDFEVSWHDSNAGESHALDIEIEGTASNDAFPRYDALFADGVYDIAVHFGGDYNKERLDISTATWLVGELLGADSGWQHDTVRTFEDLTLESGPFTRTMKVEGWDLEVRVYVYHSDMVPEDAPAEEEEKLSDAMRLSLAERDVVIYSGHAGPGAGFILDYQPKHQIDDSAFTGLTLRDDYQIYVLDGCQTYRTYVDQLMANAGKTFANLDIVTTVNTTPFSVGYQVLWEFMYWLTLTDDAGRHWPLTWKSILRGVNTDQFDSVHYGVHGIDENPGLNPYGIDALCQSCVVSEDCGAGGNLCLRYPGGSSCGVACATTAACPTGYNCRRLIDDPDYFYMPKQCVPTDYVCD